MKFFQIMAVSMVLINAYAQDVIQPVKGLKAPFEFHPDGSVKSQLNASRAVFNSDGNIQAFNVMVEFKNPNGSPNGFVKADDCLYEKDNGIVKSANKFNMERDGLNITGIGFEWSLSNKLFVVKNNATVIINAGKAGLLGQALARRQTKEQNKSNARTPDTR